MTRRAVDVGWDDEIAVDGPKDLAEDVRDAVTTKDYESPAAVRTRANGALATDGMLHIQNAAASPRRING